MSTSSPTPFSSSPFSPSPLSSSPFSPQTPTPTPTPHAQASPLIYITWFILFVCAMGTSVWGQYVTLKFPNLGMIGSYKMAMPFVWITWIFMSIAIHLSHKHKIVTPTQTILLVTILQFTFLLITNHFYLHQPLFMSDIFAFFMLLFAFYVSYENVLSKSLNIPVPTPSPTPSTTPSATPSATSSATPSAITSATPSAIPSATPSATPSSSSSITEGMTGSTGPSQSSQQGFMNKTKTKNCAVGDRYEDRHM